MSKSSLSSIIPQSKRSENVSDILTKLGLMNGKKLCNTLQGSIWRASNNTNPLTQETTVVIKVTNEFLHKKSMAIVNNKPYKVQEDILLEQNILKYLTQHKNCPKSLIKYIHFFKSKTDYVLIMEDGGSSLFEFICNAHKLIISKKIEIAHWIKVVQIIFKQMIECIDYIHSMNVCHFDISLENFLISDVHVTVSKDGNITFILDEIQVKLCDFGLAQIFKTDKCLSNSYCGKTQYKSPEIINKAKQFDAKKNDIWALGVCLFMMVIGSPPWNRAHETDAAFTYIINGHIVDILKGWNRLNYVDNHLIDLFVSIFQYEVNRYSLNDIKLHLWVQ